MSLSARQRRAAGASGVLRGARNRLFSVLALYSPGAESARVWLHRRRGMTIGEGVFIGTDALLETERPHLIEIGDRVTISMRVVVIAHFHGAIRADSETDEGLISVRIEDEAFIGPGAVILQNVTIGRGAVVNAGSVVARSVPPLTMVQGNPARPVARCGIPLATAPSVKDFYRRLRPIADGGG